MVARDDKYYKKHYLYRPTAKFIFANIEYEESNRRTSELCPNIAENYEAFLIRRRVTKNKHIQPRNLHMNDQKFEEFYLLSNIRKQVEMIHRTTDTLI